LSVTVPPTGKEIPDHGIAIFRITDGKIVEAWSEWNQLEVAQQLGVVPSSG
jgi:predicted ester cyclase